KLVNGHENDLREEERRGGQRLLCVLSARFFILREGCCYNKGFLGWIQGLEGFCSWANSSTSRARLGLSGAGILGRRGFHEACAVPDACGKRSPVGCFGNAVLCR